MVTRAMTSYEITLRPRRGSDDAWVAALAEEEWGGPLVVGTGGAHDITRLPAIVADVAGAPAGLATYDVTGDACELVSLNAVRQGTGVGAALLDAVAEVARARGCRRLWLVTTNDNTHALRFYQRRGMDLVALHRDAVSAARIRKPAIPARGFDGIPIRHELELELRLS